jgi:formamidopyrimidine-DNA glycosylase
VPELPDLIYILAKLKPRLEWRRITDVAVKEPIVVRMLAAGSFTEILKGKVFNGLIRHGPFLTFSLGGPPASMSPPATPPESVELVIHHMLAGRLQLAPCGDKPVAHLCFTLSLDDGSCLRYGDDKRMGKVYVCESGRHEGIPGYDSQGIDILSASFTFQAFEELIRGRRQQARVFLMDQSALSAIGNAYADEILFSAGIHPKTSCISLSLEERSKLYESIHSVIAWGISEIEEAGQPTEVKVRDYMRVRNRKGEACPVCGTTIRRVGVLGYDSFFCPQCQPATKKQKIPW